MNGSSLFRFAAILGHRDFPTSTLIGNLLARCVLTLGLALVPVASLYADAPATSLTIRYTGADFEGNQTFQLGWQAISNATTTSCNNSTASRRASSGSRLIPSHQPIK